MPVVTGAAKDENASALIFRLMLRPLVRRGSLNVSSRRLQPPTNILSAIHSQEGPAANIAE